MTAGATDQVSIAEQAADMFGLGALAGPPASVAGGVNADTLSIETTSGRYAVKVVPAWRDSRWLAWYQRSIGLELRALDAGIDMPVPVGLLDGQGYLVEIEATAGSRRYMRVHRWVDGERPTLRATDGSTARWIGTTLAKIHLLADPGVRPPPPGQRSPSWRELVDLAAKRGFGFAGDLEQMLGQISDAEDWLAGYPAEPTIYCRTDADQKNVLLSDSGPVLVDWDICVSHDPAGALVYTALAWAGTWDNDPDGDVAHTVIGAYQAASPTPVALHDYAAGAWVGTQLAWLWYYLRHTLNIAPEPYGGPDYEQPAADVVTRRLADLPRHLHMRSDWRRFIR